MKEFELLFDSIAKTRIVILLSHLNDFVTYFVTTRPYPIHLTFIATHMDGEVLVTSMQERATPFGSLEFHGILPLKKALQEICRNLHWFEHLHFSDFPGDLVMKLVSSNVPSIGFDIDRDTETLDLSTVNIVSSKIHIISSSREFPTKFMLSFLHRVTELDQLECFEFNRTEGRPVPDDVKKALLGAVAASKKLTKLTLSGSDESPMWDGLVEDLFSVLEKHEAFRTFRITPYPTTLDPQFAWLKQLYKRNRYIDVTDSSGDKLEADDEVDLLLGLNRFFRGSKNLKKEATITRLSFVGAALAHSAACDLPRAGQLLMHHVDLLCEILHENEQIGEA
ncbi:hypothetical protein FisN_12Hh073 [Fistulifera solaris]|uniref:Uncharacterized protein n=1 Tax=Fistulifera solaris TaxID=1519565 RepID=A0A1Z5K278_FISSO|nr:hypothetical protein FisN_12Hh073 [Fistulifera solaris]|eukprot:GAX20226.1 hypothetical protein FisN_12Hh073 [Fistulifera solaris]